MSSSVKHKTIGITTKNLILWRFALKICRWQMVKNDLTVRDDGDRRNAAAIAA